MPSANQILAALARIANEWTAVAIAWHLVVGLLLLVVATGLWRPSARTAAWVSSAPLASVALFAWLSGNPFNATVFAAAFLALAALATRTTAKPIRFAGRWGVALGLLTIAFGWLYPHFVQVQSPWEYAFRAPLGLIPCPSLSIALGAALCTRAFGSRAWGLTAGLVGLFYGVFGVFHLGVWLDAPLIVAAVATMLMSVAAHRASGTERDDLTLAARPQGSEQ